MKRILLVLFLCLGLYSCKFEIPVTDYKISITYTIYDNDTIPKTFNDIYDFTAHTGSLPCCLNDGKRIIIKSNDNRYNTTIFVYDGTHKVNVENFDYTAICKYKMKLF